MSPDGAAAKIRPEERFNPFPGLRTFEPDEDYLFFGRERQIDELLRRLRTTRFLAMVGTSGSGKSSLVRAGLIPALYGGAMTRAGSSWRVAVCRPGEDPIGNLAAALATTEALAQDENDEGVLARAFFATTLRSSHRGLVECIRQARLPPRDNVLVLVDQFEEVFRFKRSRRLAGRDEAAGFIKLLLAAARDERVPCYVALTLRSDFIGDCMDFGELPETVNAGLYLVPRMTRDELRQAIAGPVAVGGGTISPRLVSRLLNDVGDDPDQLPILQHALLRTWERWEEGHAPAEPIDLRHYEETGTMGEALSRHAEEAYEELDEEGRRIARVLFGALTDKSAEGRGIRRPAPLAEICALAGADRGAVAAVADVFRRPGRSFLMPPAAVPLREDSILDLSHESLMRIWDRLAAWVDEEARSAQLYLGVAQAAARHAEGTAGLWRDPELQLALTWRDREAPTETWARRYDPNFDRALSFLEASRLERDLELAEREERQRRGRRRARWLLAFLLAATLVTLVFAGVAQLQRMRAETAQATAETAAQIARQQEALAEGRRQEADLQRGVAESQRRRAEAERGRAETERERAERESLAAEAEKRRAEIERRRAEINALEAKAKELEAEAARSAERGERQKAEEQRRQADLAKGQAQESERQAQRLRRLSLSRTLALQVVRPWSDVQRQLPALLALEAYRLFRENGGQGENADLFNALRFSLGRLRPDPVWRGSQDAVRALAVTPDGGSAIAGGEDGRLLRFDLRQPSAPPTPLGSLPDPIRSLALRPGGDLLAAGSVAGRIEIRSLRNPAAPPRELAASGPAASALAFQPGGSRLAAGGADGGVRVWDLDRPEASAVLLQTGGKRVTAVAFTPDGETLIAGLAQGGALLWDVRRLDAAPRPACDGLDVRSLAPGPKGGRLACGAGRGAIVTSPAGGAGRPSTLLAHASSVNSLSSDREGDLLASASSDGTVRLWNLHSPDAPSLVLPGHDGWVWAVAFTPDGEHVVSGSEDRTLRLWPARSAVLVREICSLLQRAMTREEWERTMPADIPYTAGPPCPARRSQGR